MVGTGTGYPAGCRVGYSRVGVRVGFSPPEHYPYPRPGYRRVFCLFLLQKCANWALQFTQGIVNHGSDWIMGKDHLHRGKAAGQDAGAPSLPPNPTICASRRFRALFATATATSTTSFMCPRHRLTDGPPFEKEATSYLPPAFQRKAQKKMRSTMSRALLLRMTPRRFVSTSSLLFASASAEAVA